MKRHFGFEKWNLAPDQRTVATVGNFDGVHLGHQAILKTLVRYSKELSLPSVVVTFDPIPKKILYPETAPPLIQTLEQRLREIEACGVDHAIVVAFNLEFSKKSPEEFALQYLVDLLRIKTFVVGANFSFGHQKKGNIELLKQMGRKYDFSVDGIPEIKTQGIRVSSTLIRERILEGNVEKANRLMGHPFALMGTVVKGEKLGGKLGIPTANLKVENEIVPARGVYVSRSIIDSEHYPSVTNVGIRPTVGGRKLTVETHILHYSANLYGRKLELQFLGRLRNEMRFDSTERLRLQILSDIRQAEAYFTRYPPGPG